MERGRRGGLGKVVGKGEGITWWVEFGVEFECELAGDDGETSDERGRGVVAVEEEGGKGG